VRHFVHGANRKFNNIASARKQVLAQQSKEERELGAHARLLAGSAATYARVVGENARISR